MKSKAIASATSALSATTGRLPTSLVDWPATEKYEKDRAAGSAVPEAAQLDKELEQQREVEESHLPRSLPDSACPKIQALFLLDSYQGESQIVEVQQTVGDVIRNTKANILAAPSIPSPA